MKAKLGRLAKSGMLRQAVIGAVGMAAIIGIGGLLAMLYGPVNAIAYSVIFVFFLTLMPVAIGIMGNALPGSGSLGKLHIILGAMAFDHHYLVEREDTWEWCPGERGRVYVDEEWHEIDGGLDNLSVLGWRPFGIIPYKGDQRWVQNRVDEKAKKLRGEATTDGGSLEQTRAGWDLQEPPIRSGVDGTWVLDLKRIYSSGINKIGDIELIETAEEIIERGQVDESRMGGWRPYIETVSGIILGVLAGGAYVFLG